MHKTNCYKTTKKQTRYNGLIITKGVLVATEKSIRNLGGFKTSNKILKFNLTETFRKLTRIRKLTKLTKESSFP